VQGQYDVSAAGEILIHRIGIRVVVHVVPAEEHLPDRAAVQKNQDRKSTRLNSSHGSISYAVFCLKKKKRSEVEVVSKRCGMDFDLKVFHVGECRETMLSRVPMFIALEETSFASIIAESNE